MSFVSQVKFALMFVGGFLLTVAGLATDWRLGVATLGGLFVLMALTLRRTEDSR